jgi:hypothetical protein
LTPKSRDKDLRLLIINTIATRMSRPEAKKYLEDKGYIMSLKQYDRIKKGILGDRHKRVNEIANTGFIDAHLEALDTFLEIKRQMWINYNNETHPYKRVEILTQIANLQPYLNEYYAATKDIMIDKTKAKLSQEESPDNNKE